MKKLIAILFSALLLSGCASLKSGLKLAKGAAPDYAAALSQIEQLVSTGSAVELPGYAFSRTYFFEGRVVADPSKITWEDKWTKTGSADKAQPPSTATNKASAADVDLESDINAIFDKLELP